MYMIYAPTKSLSRAKEFFSVWRFGDPEPHRISQVTCFFRSRCYDVAGAMSPPADAPMKVLSEVSIG